MILKKQKSYSFSHFVLLLLSAGLFLFSCVDTSTSNKRKSTSSGSSESSDNDGEFSDAPDFNQTLNFFQEGSQQSSTTFNLQQSFKNSMFLRGTQIDTFIRNGNTSLVNCLLIPFSNNTSEIVVVAATPRFIFNFQKGTQEFYYFLEPSNTSLNQTFCQKPALLSFIATNFSSLTTVFQLSNICNNCAVTSILSDPVTIRTEDGLNISSISTTSLRIKLFKDSLSTPVNPNLSCTNSAECIAKGFDCCSGNQCADDKEPKSGVDQSSQEFLQALEDIKLNEAAIFNYTHLFHICSTEVPVLPTPTPLPDPVDEANERFLNLKRLFDCITPIEGEMSLCTVSFDSVLTAGTTTFATGSDDRNFNTTYSGNQGIPAHSIHEVLYAGEFLFKDNAIVKGMTIGPNGNGSGNDNLNDTQVIDVTHTPAPSAPDDKLFITYKIDGSCEKINTFLARCQKFYVQGQNLGRIDDHFPASNDFLLPNYADTNKTITVEVDDNLKFFNVDWQLIQTTPARVEFFGPNLKVFDTQVLKVTFFVDLQSNPNVLLKKKEAIDSIKASCDCVGDGCGLKEVKDEQETVINFECVYPEPDIPPPPLQQIVLLDAKSVPHLYFDEEGVFQADPTSSTPDQEGNLFEYTNGDLLKPNNVSEYIGFNEIYGSFTTNPLSAVPAKTVQIEKGKTYDIFVDSGTFSTCFSCGNDYYSQLVKLFPSNFIQKGGGYQPDLSISDPFSTTTFRSDDLHFGRSCFVPATMIPWTHSTESIRQQQRLKRLSAQHFLFANGYNRDWYGFDYGSIIGSFDGVTWFSVGNTRRIQAKTTKLFLAVNAYFGDQTAQSNFSILVQDASTSTAGAGSLITNDFDSDGAECQKQHVCDTDKDCIAQVGWDYSCETITALTSEWPVFDANGIEVPGDSRKVNLRTEFNASTGGAKRCVYRGRGAACAQNFIVNDGANSYSGTTLRGMHACSANSYCQQFIQGISVNKFNDRISRFGRSVRFQNASSTITEDDLDEFGKSSRVIGRPLDYNGSNAIPLDAQAGLSANNLVAMCIPGRDVADQSDSVVGNNSSTPTIESNGDKVNAIGMTPSLQVGGTGRLDYLSRCSILDASDNYYFKSLSPSLQMGDNSISNLVGHQAISTNALAIFEAQDLTGSEIIKDFNNSFIDTPILEENRCLRVPGSVCHTDMDCAPSKFIANKVANLNTDDGTVLGIINGFEVKFWQEGLVCSQERTIADEDFELSDNRCCRETGNILTIGNPKETAVGSAPDLDISTPSLTSLAPISAQDRYNRYQTIMDLLLGSPATHPPPLVADKDICDAITPANCKEGADTDNQFNSIHDTATRTCCSGHWIRNFNKEDNGGGHIWSAGKMQTIPKSSFQCMNWLPCIAGTSCGNANGDGLGFSCDHVDDPDDPNCLIKATPISEARPIFDWLGTLELLGVPQIRVKTQIANGFSEIICEVQPGNQTVASIAATPFILPELLKLPSATIKSSVSDIPEYETGNFPLFSAGDKDNFNTDTVKMIFSPDETVCCTPAGTRVPEGTDPVQCCTGFINQQDGNRCALDDNTDVSVYLNRYISSAAKDESSTLFDSETGYLKSENDVIRIACAQEICASKTLVPGVSLSSLAIPGHADKDKRRQRFVDGGDEVNNVQNQADNYDIGLRWNTHIYCVSADTNLATAIDCTSF
jgi:hypothetical protein